MDSPTQFSLGLVSQDFLTDLPELSTVMEVLLKVSITVEDVTVGVGR